MAAIGDIEALKMLIALDDGAAYKKLFIIYHAKLLKFSFSFTHCKESAEEIVSDVFLKIWLRRKFLNQIANLHLYLYVSAKNLSLNYVLKQKRVRTFSLQYINSEFDGVGLNPEQIFLSGELYQRIHFAVNHLPPKCHLIFKLIKEDGLKYKQVAELLGLSLKTVECQMSIALRKISLGTQFDFSKISPH